MAVSPTVEAYLNQLGQQQASGGGFDANQYVQRYPDIAQYYASNPNLAKQFPTLQDFAKYHYQTNGTAEGRQGYVPSYVASDGKTFADQAAYSDYQTNYDRTKTQTATQQALAKARFNAENAIKSRGLDPTQYSSVIEEQLARIQGMIPEFDSNPGSYFDPNLANDVLSGITATNRNQYKQQVNTQLGSNYDTKNITSSILDSTINDILGRQTQEATDALERGKKRGQLNEIGYQAGSGKLNQQRTAATQKLGSTADDVLNSYRSKVDLVNDRATNAASGYNLGDTFNLDDYLGEANSIVGDAQKNASGKLLNTIGDQSFFDTSSLLQTAGQAQGAQNLNNLDVLDALEKKKMVNNQGRGLGSQGAF